MKAIWTLPFILIGAACAQEFKVGSPVANFSYSDVRGSTANFDGLRGKTTVVIFISTNCPISNAYDERMNSLYREYFAKGVNFLFLNSNSNESAADVAENAKNVGFAFPVYKDNLNAAADRFGAQSTPESYGIDPSGTLRYHGSIDDSANPTRVTRHGLQSAIDAVMAGKAVSTPETKAFGCTIKRVRHAS